MINYVIVTAIVMLVGHTIAIILGSAFAVYAQRQSNKRKTP